MSSEFMPMALDSLARQQSARAAGSGASSRITEEELEELGIPVNKPGEIGRASCRERVSSPV